MLVCCFRLSGGDTALLQGITYSAYPTDRQRENSLLLGVRRLRSAAATRWHVVVIATREE